MSFLVPHRLRNVNGSRHDIEALSKLCTWSVDYHRTVRANPMRSNPIGWYLEKMYRRMKADKHMSWTRAFKESWAEAKSDYNFMNSRGRYIIEQGIPQLSLFEGALAENTNEFIVTHDKNEHPSEAYLELIDDRLIFHGYLCHNNPRREGIIFTKHVGVGFCNFHTPPFDPVLDFEDFHTVALKLRTDGRDYSFIIEHWPWRAKKPVLFRGIIHLPRTPPGEWDYIEIPLEHFVPSEGSSLVAMDEHFDITQCTSYGMDVIGDQGHFCLEVEWIRMFSEEHRYALERPKLQFIQALAALDIPYSELWKMQECGEYKQPVLREMFRDTEKDPSELADRMRRMGYGTKEFDKLDEGQQSYIADLIRWRNRRIEETINKM